MTQKPWRAGDHVGTGALYLPDEKAREEYAKACKAAIVESAARHVLGLENIADRRAFIDAHPMAEIVKQRVKALWASR